MTATQNVEDSLARPPPGTRPQQVPQRSMHNPPNAGQMQPAEPALGLQGVYRNAMMHLMRFDKDSRLLLKHSMKPYNPQFVCLSQC